MDLLEAANAAAGRAASGLRGRDPTPPAGAVGYVHMEGDQSLDHVPFCADISTAQNGAVLEAGSVEDDSAGPMG